MLHSRSNHTKRRDRGRVLPTFSGFSLMEVMVALMILGMASSALLLATSATVETAENGLMCTVARGVAEQILDDLLGQPYHENGSTSTQWPLGPESGETASPAKTILFDDTDDYAGYSSSPPRDRWGIELGKGNGNGGSRTAALSVADGFFKNWSVKVSMTYANQNNPSQDLSGGQTSGIRAARVTITRTVNGNEQQLVSLRRVFAYVAPTGA